MIRSPIAAITILSLVLLAVCCQILPSMHMHAHTATDSTPELVIHLILLTMSVPSSIVVFVLMLAAFLRLVTEFPAKISDTSSLPYRYGRQPDAFFTAPLRLAIADGIINPKGY